LRVQVGLFPEMVDVRLRGQASPPARHASSCAVRLVPLSVSLSMIVFNSQFYVVPYVFDLLHRLQLCFVNALPCSTVRRTVRRNS
jgi:hypothetical protein